MSFTTTAARRASVGFVQLVKVVAVQIERGLPLDRLAFVRLGRVVSRLLFLPMPMVLTLYVITGTTTLRRGLGRCFLDFSMKVFWIKRVERDSCVIGNRRGKGIARPMKS